MLSLPFLKVPSPTRMPERKDILFSEFAFHIIFGIFLFSHVVLPNKVLIIFDIPETKRKGRGWIRNQIKEWDFKMVQKSVWIGYGPLPKEFTERLKSLKVSEGVRVYNLRKKQ